MERFIRTRVRLGVSEARQNRKRAVQFSQRALDLYQAKAIERRWERKVRQSKKHIKKNVFEQKPKIAERVRMVDNRKKKTNKSLLVPSRVSVRPCWQK